MTPELVARTKSRRGGPCAHCGDYIAEDEPVFKLAPGCCEKHQRHTGVGRNGPGRWVCHSCNVTLLQGSIHDG